MAVLTAVWIHLNTEWCRYGSVGIVTTVRAGRSGVRVPTRAGGVSLLLSEQTGSESHTASYSLSTGVKRLWRRAKVKNEWSSATVPPMCLRGVDRSILYLYLYLYLWYTCSLYWKWRNFDLSCVPPVTQLSDSRLTRNWPQFGDRSVRAAGLTLPADLGFISAHRKCLDCGATCCH